MESGKSQQMPSEQAPVEFLTRTPYIQVLTYPRVSLRSAKARIRQLRNIGVTSLVFEGHARIGRLGILGIGTVGVVVRAKAGEEVLALKVRRTDANRPDMQEEARITAMANKLGVGPAVRSHTKDFILMKLLEYRELDEWLRGLKGPGSRGEARGVVHALLNQCRKLDIMGIDHGQLSNLRKHAVVAEGAPWIIDFESASTSRLPRNVTSAAQYLLVGGRIAPRMRRALGIRETRPLIGLLADYKTEMSDYRYSKLLEHLKLVNQ
jgi:putative serine/threonine protein kinase